MAAPAPRRITPQAVTGEAPATVSTGRAGGAEQGAGGNAGHSTAVEAATDNSGGRNEALMASATVPRGGLDAIAEQQQATACRRLHVNIRANNVLNYRKLCKQWRKKHGLKGRAHPGLEARLTGPPEGSRGSPGGADSLLRKFDGKKEGSKRNDTVLSNVIKRLEQMYSAKVGDDSDGEDDGDSDGDGEGGSQGTQGKSKAQIGKGLKRKAEGGDDGDEAIGGGDDNYNHDDPFIDDSEMVDLYEADVKRPKHGGFFINKGSIEKVEDSLQQQLTPFSNGTRKKQSLPTNPTKTATKTKKTKSEAKKPLKATGKKDKGDRGPSTPLRPKMKKQNKATSGATPTKSHVRKEKLNSEPQKPSVEEGSGKEVKNVISERLQQLIDKFKQMAEAHKTLGKDVSVERKEGASRGQRLPGKLEKLLHELALQFFRDWGESDEARQVVLAALGEAVASFGFEDPQGTMWNKMKNQYGVAKKRLRNATNELQQAVAKAVEEQKASLPDPPTAPSSNLTVSKSQEEDEFQVPNKPSTVAFEWTNELDKLLLNVVDLSHKLHGWPASGSASSQKHIYQPLCKFWPDWLPMDVKKLHSRYKKIRPKATKEHKRPNESSNPSTSAKNSKKTANLADLTTSAGQGKTSVTEGGQGAAGAPSVSGKSTPVKTPSKMQQTKLPIAAMAAAAGAKAIASRASPSDPAEHTESIPPGPRPNSPAAAAAKPAVGKAKPAAQALTSAMEGEGDVSLHERFIQKAISNGGDESVLRSDFPDDIGSKRGDAIPAKSVAILALCDAGPRGLAIKEMVTRVNELGLADWEEKKKNYLSSGVMKDDRIMRMEKHRYVLRAFKEVTELKPAPRPTVAPDSEATRDAAEVSESQQCAS